MPELAPDSTQHIENSCAGHFVRHIEMQAFACCGRGSHNGLRQCADHNDESNLAAKTSFISGLCLTVTHVNNDKHALSFNIFEWKLQDPNGVARSMSIFGDNDLGSGELAPGGTVTGDVCFEGARVRPCRGNTC